MRLATDPQHCCCCDEGACSKPRCRMVWCFNHAKGRQVLGLSGPKSVAEAQQAPPAVYSFADLAGAAFVGAQGPASVAQARQEQERAAWNAQARYRAQQTATAGWDQAIRTATNYYGGISYQLGAWGSAMSYQTAQDWRTNNAPVARRRRGWEPDSQPMGYNPYVPDSTPSPAPSDGGSDFSGGGGDFGGGGASGDF